MKNQSGRPSLNGLLSITSLWNHEPRQPAVTDVPPIDRTFSNDSTFETNPNVITGKRPPPAPTSVTQCDIFRPLREAFFSEDVEDMLTLRRARPVACCGSLLDIEEEEEQDLEANPVPLTRQDALMATLEMLDRDKDDDDSLIGMYRNHRVGRGPGRKNSKN